MTDRDITPAMMDAGQRYLDDCVKAISQSGFALPATFRWHEFWAALNSAREAGAEITKLRERLAEVEGHARFWEERYREAVRRADEGPVEMPS